MSDSTTNGQSRTARRLRVEQTGEEVIIRVPTMGTVLRQFLPDETVTHMEAAQKESLMAVRSLIDAAIKSLDERAHQQSNKQEPPRRVDITVD